LAFFKNDKGFLPEWCLWQQLLSFSIALLSFHGAGKGAVAAGRERCLSL